jgi:UDP-N-acetylglucosamine--N-acetylmuramyl-(pentapeptide) pyrophosphoryl-undecaprenol N-acetylglucosamine transferase
VLSRWAVSIGTGAPLENYNYPASKAHFVGIPVSKQLVVLGDSQRAALKQELGLSSRPLVLITGGGLGAKRINDATVAVADRLVADCTTLLVCGVGQYSELQDAVTHLSAKDFKLVPHVVSSEFVRLLSAADIVVSRAGATTMLELAALAKPTILIPNARLTGGHQLKNANAYEKKHAAVIVNDEALETEPDVLATAIHELLADTSMRERLATAIHQFATPHAARDMARLILAAKKH